MPDHHTAARPSAAAGYRPVLIFAVLGAVSGLAGTFGLEIGISSRNGFGLSMIPTGIWFCAVVAAAVTWLGRATPSGAAVAILATFAGWEAAVNLSLLLLDPLYKHGQGNAGLAVIGLFCGAVGSLFTWAGAAWAVPALRRRSSAVLVVVAGTLLQRAVLPLIEGKFFGRKLSASALHIARHLRPAAADRASAASSRTRSPASSAVSWRCSAPIRCRRT